MSENKKFRVLAIDDESMSLKVLEHLLTSLGAEEIERADSVKMATIILKNDPKIKLIVSDHYMKDSSGIHLLAQVRQGKLAVPHDTYFIISTSSQSFVLAAAAMSLHVDSFMSKPFSKEELARRIYDFMHSEKRVIQPPEYYQAMDVDEMIAAAQAQDPLFQKNNKPLKMTPLNKVPPDSPLVADLVDKSGDILLRKGTLMSSHIIKRLYELKVAEVPIG